MKMTVVRILLVLAPLLLWMVSRVPLEGIAVAEDRATGREVFLQNCALCHVSGLGMAPRVDNLQEWESRLSAGRSVLQASVLRGKGGMPPKGGNASISDSQAVAALDYMVSRVLQSERNPQVAGR
ncbi:MAG: c-type cytochrome [Rhodocyclales bacterium]|nr:c-type cytochrome [Rhodocyclales bacterium]